MLGFVDYSNHVDPISAPAVNLRAIQVWYKVETNCCRVGNQVWKSWEDQFLELLAPESRTVLVSRRWSLVASRDSEKLLARRFKDFLDRRRPGRRPAEEEA
jgi:hypothetical protein